MIAPITPAMKVCFVRLADCTNGQAETDVMLAG
jgi:hypothetical protein